MDLTNEDIADILAVLDSLPYDELDLQTPRFRLTLRRAPGGGWTEASQVLAEPTAVTPAPNGSSDTAPQSRPRDTSAAGGDAGDAGPRAAGGAAGDAGPRAAGGDAGDAGPRAAGATTGDAGPHAAGATTGDAVAVGAGGSDAIDVSGLVAVTAPLPGTFYRAPRPGAAPFVEVGDEVSEDTVVAIVETMKLMNSVHAGTRGQVAEICARNAEPTAQGATLMWITPEGR
jgi:acetyl-CoA carboxylase biotin carboxyl carrier protein